MQSSYNNQIIFMTQYAEKKVMQTLEELFKMPLEESTLTAHSKLTQRSKDVFEDFISRSEACLVENSGWDREIEREKDELKIRL